MASLDSCGQTLELTLSHQPRSPAPFLAGAISVASISAAVSLARHRPLPRAGRRRLFLLLHRLSRGLYLIYRIELDKI
jgi:hypothetical protein